MNIVKKRGVGGLGEDIGCFSIAVVVLGQEPSDAQGLGLLSL